MSYCIYLVTNTVNQKRYIGFTKNFRVRRRAHKYLAHHGSKQAIHCAIRKHGWEKFSWEILYESEDRNETLNSKEPEFIRLYQSNDSKHGYNQTAGGEHYELTEEARKKISDAKKGSKMSDHVKEALRKANVGRPFSESHIAALQQAQQQRYKTKSSPLRGRKLSKAHREQVTKTLRHFHDDTSKAKIAEKNSRVWSVVHPDGRQQLITNLAAFCREHQLVQSALSMVASGRRDNHKGFRCSKG